MDVARLNFSHGDATTHRQAVAAVRAAAEATGRHIALLQDLQGPKVRIGALPAGELRLVRGGKVRISPEPAPVAEGTLSVNHPEVIHALGRGRRVLVADGEIELRVEAASGDSAACTVVRGGVLRERQGITVPGVALDLPAITAKDRADLALGAELGFDYVALSFVRSEADLQACHAQLAQLGWSVPVVAKLERKAALSRLGAILAAADGVMVARGDLGVELPLGQVPAVQKDLIERANRSGVPVITATEMLESMVSSNRPTRAEASDVANAIWDGTDAVMLSRETSTGSHPVESVRAMAAVCSSAEGHPAYQRARAVWYQRGSVGGAIAHAAAAVVEELRARAVVAFTETGETARRVSKARPPAPVLVASPHAAVLRRSQLYAGVVPLLVAASADTDDMMAKATEAALQTGRVRRGDRLVLVAGVPVGRPGATNLLRVETIA
jgi:pyruvate kinase